MRKNIGPVLLALLVSACGGGGGGGGGGSGDPPAPVTPPPVTQAPYFSNATAGSNIAYEVGYTESFEGSLVTKVSFGGAAAGDCDADGDVDLFITYGDQGPNRLYINQLNMGSGVPLQFVDRAEAARVANTRADGRNDRHSGPTFADMDGDGDLDLFIGGLLNDSNKLYRNAGDCTFEDVSADSGLDSLLTDNTLSAAFGDYDLDGDLDLFLTHWESINEFPALDNSEHLFRNVSDENGIRFENVSASAGLTAYIASRAGSSTMYTDWTFTPTFARINEDEWPDIALVADFSTSQLFINDASAPGHFLDATNDAIRSIQYGMGSALGDIDSDGDLDWFVSAVYGGQGETGETLNGNVLLENPGGDFAVDNFRDITGVAGVADGRWGWGSCLLDIDNDTDLDIYHTNGWEETAREQEFGPDPSQVFISDGTGSRFSAQGQQYGLNDTYSGRGVVCADFDNDGDVDILQLTNNPTNSGVLWRNDTATAGRNFIRIRLIGLPPNTEAAGARIFLRLPSRTQMREITIGSNYTSQNPAIQVVGLGTNTVIDEIRVEWPARLPGPDRPDDWIKFGVPAGVAGATLTICHPDLQLRPANCTAPD